MSAWGMWGGNVLVLAMVARDSGGAIAKVMRERCRRPSPEAGCGSASARL